MMKKIFSNRAISLLELIIASVLVVIMILGIFAVNMVLSNSNEDYGQKYFVKSSTQTTLNHILNNASLAIGSGVNVQLTGGQYVPDQGIILGGDPNVGWGDSNSFCIHQDIPPPPYTGTVTIDNAAVNTPPSSQPNYNNSRWLCYTWYPANTTYGNTYAYTIYYCAMSYTLSDYPSRGAGSCNPTLTSGNVAQYLGTAQSNPSVSFSINAVSSAPFSITIQNCLNNSVSNCVNTSVPGCSGSSASNPAVCISGTINPPQQGVQQS